jgi:O-acetyl-ADP-ribose deacetylase (regulator of RNase III)
MLILAWWDGKNLKSLIEVARVGRDFDAQGNLILANRPYRLNADHKFELVPVLDRIQIERGNIIEQAVHVVVNAANESLLGGGGVDGAIHEAAGPALLEECKTLGGAQPGEVKLTAAYKLPAWHIAHAVGPRWQGGEKGEAELLAKVYRTAIELGLQRGAVTFAFPSISTGAFGYPLEQAAAIVVQTIRDAIAETRIAFVRIVCFDEGTLKAYEAAREALRS